MKIKWDQDGKLHILQFGEQSWQCWKAFIKPDLIDAISWFYKPKVWKTLNLVEIQKDQLQKVVIGKKN